MDKISVIIPAYNAEKSIKTCIDSVQNNTYRNLEIIVVDDGSSDQTTQIVEDLRRTDSRIVLVSKENRGVSSARNMGIALAQGQILMFLDADDTFEPSLCETVAQKFSEHKPDIVMFGYREIFNDEIRIHKCPVDGVLASQEKIFTCFVEKTYFSGINGYLGSVWLAGWLADHIREWDLSFNENVHHGEDKLFLLEYLFHCQKMIGIEDALYNYMLGDKSVTKNYSPYLANNNKAYGECWHKILTNAGHVYTNDMRGQGAVTDVISTLLNEARANNPYSFFAQIRHAATANRTARQYIGFYHPDSKVMRIKKLIASHSVLCVCFYLTRRIHRALGVYF